MSLHNDEQFLAAVAAALGESIDLVRRRGFHLETTNHDPAPRYTAQAPKLRATGSDDPVDMATLGIDWDSYDDSRLHRRRRKPLILPRTRRSRRAA
ncbi:MAG: hypothetical protein ACKOK8_07330 [Planctomycetia bacterium]